MKVKIKDLENQMEYEFENISLEEFKNLPFFVSKTENIEITPTYLLSSADLDMEGHLSGIYRRDGESDDTFRQRILIKILRGN